LNAILLIPIYNCASLLPTLFGHLYRLDPQPERVIFAENNSRDNTLERLTKFKRPHEIIRVWFRSRVRDYAKSPYEPIAHIRQLLLTRARHLNPDYAIFFDHDCWPNDHDIIDRLTLHGEDIVGGAYLRAYPEGVFLASKWVHPDTGKIIWRKTALRPYGEVNMTSAGCLCLSQRIIQDHRVNFYPLYDNVASEDYGYCLTARQFGYKIWLDATASCMHFLDLKREKPWTTASNQKDAYGCYQLIDFKY